MRPLAPAVLLLLAALSACSSAPRIEVESPPLVARVPDDGRTVAHCFGDLPHIEGSAPFVLGGACCHYPSPEIVEAYRRDGTISDDDSTVTLLALYRTKGIQLETDHRGCNNRCSFGPHVVKGGRCMVAPTPGTVNYEEIRSGRFPRRSAEPHTGD